MWFCGLILGLDAFSKLSSTIPIGKKTEGVVGRELAEGGFGMELYGVDLMVNFLFLS
jgi:hypothetical protein